MSSFSSLPPSPGDTFYQNSVDINLLESDTYVDTAGYARFNLYSDSTVSSQRQITLAPSDLEGQQITLILMSGDDTTCLLSTISTSYLRIETAWTPLQYDQLTLQWSKGLWIEVSRSASGTGGFNPIITNPQSGDILIYSGSEWENHQVDGEFQMNDTGNMDFRYVSSPVSGELLAYDGTHWVNSGASLSWQPLVTDSNWSGSGFVAEFLGNLLLYRGEFTSSNGTTGTIATSPVSITGDLIVPCGLDTVGSYAAGACQITGNTISTSGGSVFTGYKFRLDGICISKSNT